MDLLTAIEQVDATNAVRARLRYLLNQDECNQVQPVYLNHIIQILKRKYKPQYTGTSKIQFGRAIQYCQQVDYSTQYPCHITYYVIPVIGDGNRSINRVNLQRMVHALSNDSLKYSFRYDINESQSKQFITLIEYKYEL